MSQKLLSQDSFFEVADVGSPGGFLRVGGVRAINNLRSGQATEIDMSDLSSVEKETALGLPDPGTMDVDLLFDPNDPGQRNLATLRSSRALSTFRVGAPNAMSVGSPTGFSLWTFSGRVQTFPFSLAVDSAQTGSVTVRISGSIAEQL